MSDATIAALTAIRDSIHTPPTLADATSKMTARELPTDLPSFPSPSSLIQQLLALGMSYHLSEKISGIYMRQAEELSKSSLQIALKTCSQLTQSGGSLSLQRLQSKVYESHLCRYETTISQWAEEAIEEARSYLIAVPDPYIEKKGNEQPERPKKTKRHFKTEYLPLFEFAFEKDRFPNREDKKHLAKISGMSYQQVCVWFQNRRCRHASRGKSHHSTPPPRTFEEMKERLGTSARKALSRAPSTLKDVPCTPSPEASSSFTPSFQIAVIPPNNGLKEETALVHPVDQALFLGAPQVSEYIADHEGNHGLRDDGSVMDRVHLQRSIPSSYTSVLVIEPHNPLNPLQSSTASVFPSPYHPSKATVNPFVVKHGPWLRNTQDLATTQLVDPTPETMDNIIEGFDNMEVDVPMLDADSSSSSVTMHSEPGPLTLPHTNTSSHHLPPKVPRTCSSGSSASWSSDAPTSPSRSASYSTAPSSVLSSPNRSEICLPNQSECEIAPLKLTAPSPSADEESTCHTPVDEVTSRAGPFGASSIKPTSKARVDEWVSGVSTQQEDDHTANKWQQLLAAAAAEASPAA